MSWSMNVQYKEIRKSINPLTEELAAINLL